MRLIVYGVRLWIEPEAKELSRPTGTEDEQIKVLADGCDTRLVSKKTSI